MSRWQVLFLVFLIGCGKSDGNIADPIHRVRSQIFAANLLIDKHNPDNTRLARSTNSNSVFATGFDFMIGKRLEEFPEIGQLADTLDIGRPPLFKDPYLEKWSEKFPKNATYKYVFTDLWELGDGSDMMDLLVFVLQDDKVVAWSLFPQCNY